MPPSFLSDSKCLFLVEYDNLDPPVAAELVVRSKQAHAPAVTATYGYGAPPMPGPPPAAGNPMANLPAAALQQLAAIPNIAQLLSSMDPNTLQKFISGLQRQPPPPTQPTYGVPQSVTPQQDLASLLSRAQQQAPQQHQPVPNQYGQPQQQHGGQGQGALAAYGGTSGLAALLGQASQKVQQQQAQQQAQQQQAQQHQGPGQGAGQLPNIMETLAKWKQS